MSEHFLVTGASGFVGAAVARRVLDAGKSVRVLLRASSDRRNIQDLDVEVAVGDLRDPASLVDACRGCEGLFHVAADYRLWVRDPAELYASNVQGSRNMLLAAADSGISRMVYTSSVATLGLNADGSPADERTPVTLEDMVGHYKRSKFLAEKAVTELISERNLPVVIVNPSTPIGPGDIKPTPTGRVVVDAANGRMPAFVDTGLNVAHVDDVADGHWRAYERGEVGERYLLGGENLSLQEILALVAGFMGRKPPSIRLPHQAVMPIAWIAEAWARLSGGADPIATVDGVRMAKKKMYFSHAKAAAALGYQSRPASDALRDALDWFASVGYCPARSS